jgi:hypothetical protein
MTPSQAPTRPDAPSPVGTSLRRVAILGSRGYPSTYGGFETFVRRLAPWLVAQGLDVSVYTRDGVRWGSEEADGVRRWEDEATYRVAAALLDLNPPDLPRATYVRDLLAAVDAALADWRPDLLLISAGFDSLAGDPLGGFTLEPEDITQWTAALRERVAPAPVVAVLEGGYRLDLLAAGARATVQALA